MVPIGHCLYPAKFTYLVGGAAVPSVIRVMYIAAYVAGSASVDAGFRVHFLLCFLENAYKAPDNFCL